MLTLYSDQRSGNCYKVRLGLSQLRRRYRLVDVDIISGATRTPDFLARNPAGRVPLLEVAPGRYLPESGAILWYLAENSRLIPADPFDRADVLRWMFFEQYSHEPYIGTARFWLSLVKGGRELQAHLIEDWSERGYQALGVMERHLTDRDWFAAGRYTIADIALYAYTHVAHEAEFDLTGFPAIRRWLRRVANEPGHVSMDWRPQAATIVE
jgi:glutathione S-transferase